MWNKLSARIYDYLDGLTLAEAVAQSSEPREDEQGGVRFGSGLHQSAA
jgi:DNA-binding IscR family transcriptional regulator